MTLYQTSNFKFQSSNKLQITNYEVWYLIFVNSLVFAVWCLNFASGGYS